MTVKTTTTAARKINAWNLPDILLTSPKKSLIQSSKQSLPQYHIICAESGGSGTRIPQQQQMRGKRIVWANDVYLWYGGSKEMQTHVEWWSDFFSHA